MALTGKTILIVDDDDGFLAELQELLAASGCVALAVKSGRRAVFAAKKFKADAVLLDLRLGRTSGFDVARELRLSPETAHIPIVLMSGHFSGRDSLRCFRSHEVNSCLAKPFSPKAVTLTLLQVLEDKAPVRV